MAFHEKWRRAGPGVVFLILCFAICVALSCSPRNFSVIDQGDYPRTVSRIVHSPIEEIGINSPYPIGEEWVLLDGRLLSPNLSSGTSSLVFYFMARLQSLLGSSYSFNFVYSVFSLVLIVSAFSLSFVIVRRVNGSTAFVGIGAVFFCVFFFVPYTGPFLRSFYAEFAFIVFFPALLLSFAAPTSYAGLFFRFFAVTACATAKTQLFYIPLLYCFACLALRPQGERTTSRFLPFVLLMAVAQVIAIGPVLRSDYTATNSHHSTYFGSYLVMAERELSAIGVSSKEQKCIGVDAWGNRINHPSDLSPEAGSPCKSSRIKGLSDMVGPYLANPLLLLRLLNSSEDHFTTNYFHVHERNIYVHQTEESLVSSALLDFAELRETLTSVAFFLVVAAVLICLLIVFKDSTIRSMLVFLALFPPSQIAVSLIGEGVRDLSKHLLMANYAADIGVAVVLLLCLSARSLEPGAPQETGVRSIHSS